MNILVVTPPTVEPITAGEAFFKLKITTDPQDVVETEPQYAEVMRAITTAREYAERYTRRAIVQQTLRLLRGPIMGTERRGLQWYMNGGASDWGQIELLRPPLISVSSVKYYDDSNVLQTVDPASYFTAQGLVATLRFVDGFQAPSTYLREDAIQIEYVAGYAPSDATPTDYRANVPDGIKAAILLGVQLQIDALTPAEFTMIERARDSLLKGFQVYTL